MNISPNTPPPSGITDRVDWSVANIQILKGRVTGIIASGGGGGTTPTLNAVLTAGNNTSLGINIGNATATIPYGSIYLGGNVGNADLSGELKLRNVSDVAGHYQYFIHATTSPANSFSQILLFAGSSSTANNDKVTITAQVGSPAIIVYSTTTAQSTLTPTGLTFYVASLNTTTLTPAINRANRTQTLPDMNGMVGVYNVTRATAQIAANTGVAVYELGASDGSFLISANVNITTSTLFSFTATCAYTDETNTAQTETMSFNNLAGTSVTVIANAAGVVPYTGIPSHIRCKAGTFITIATVGTFTTVVYNIEAMITQIQ